MTEAKTWTPEEIKALLGESDKAVARAILAIYNRQTEDEKIVKETSAANGVGYSGVDANFMSTGQLKYGRKAIMKYAGQLTEIANA